MIYFVYVKYSNDKNLKNFFEFKKIVDNLSEFNKGVIVENGCTSSENKFAAVDIINGSNDYFDLSAYDEGLKYLRNSNNISEKDLFIFANDTLLLKHKFSKITKSYIRWKIKRLVKSGVDFAFGDIDQSKLTRYNRWISTYFFIITIKGINLFETFVINENVYKNMIIKVEPPDIVWGRYFNPDFQIEINRWLNPESENNYFKLNDLKIKDNFFRIKLHNVISERFISDVLIRNQVKLYPIRPNLFFKIIRKIEIFQCI